jgi:predicted transport protein
MPKNKQEVFNLFRKLAISMGEDVTQERLQIYTEYFSKKDFVQLAKTISKGVTRWRFFPKIAEIEELLNPSVVREESDLLAGRIIESIRKFGMYRSKEAQIYVGPEAWNAVNFCGGWQALCDTPQEQLGMLRAQLRASCNSVIKSDEIEERINKRISNKTEQVENKKPGAINYVY